eukprot:4270369-Prymnesium_polylepis.2
MVVPSSGRVLRHLTVGRPLQPRRLDHSLGFDLGVGRPRLVCVQPDRGAARHTAAVDLAAEQ